MQKAFFILGLFVFVFLVYVRFGDELGLDLKTNDRHTCTTTSYDWEQVSADISEFYALVYQYQQLGELIHEETQLGVMETYLGDQGDIIEKLNQIYDRLPPDLRDKLVTPDALEIMSWPPYSSVR
jgi:hypothetical protein